MSRFNGMGQHIANPRTAAQMRANNMGGSRQDEQIAATAATHTELFASGAVKLAVATAAVSAATIDDTGRKLGTGTATVYSLAMEADGVTPRLNAEGGQTVYNPLLTAWVIGSSFWVVDASQVKLIVTLPLSQLIGTAPTVAGSRGGNAALASALVQLSYLGLVQDSTTA